MFLSRKALIEKNAWLRREVDRLKKQIDEIFEEKRKAPANCTPGEWCKACAYAYVDDYVGPFGPSKVATCTRHRCAEFLPSGYLSCAQTRNDRKEP